MAPVGAAWRTQNVCVLCRPLGEPMGSADCFHVPEERRCRPRKSKQFGGGWFTPHEPRLWEGLLHGVLAVHRPCCVYS